MKFKICGGGGLNFFFFLNYHYKNWDRLPVFTQETIYHVRTETRQILSQSSQTFTGKCNGDIITDNDTMNGHKSECILIQSILYNNVFYHTWKQLFLVAKRNLQTLCVRGFVARQYYFTCS